MFVSFCNFFLFPLAIPLLSPPSIYPQRTRVYSATSHTRTHALPGKIRVGAERKPSELGLQKMPPKCQYSLGRSPGLNIWLVGKRSFFARGGEIIQIFKTAFKSCLSIIKKKLLKRDWVEINRFVYGWFIYWIHFKGEIWHSLSIIDQVESKKRKT